MVCRQVGAKPSSETMLKYCQLDMTLMNKRLWNFNQSTNIFSQENVFESILC